MRPEAFRESVLATLRDLRRAGDGHATRVIQVPLHDRAALVLRPVVLDLDVVGDRDVELITAWRNRHRESFLSCFTATLEGTRHWLRQLRETEDRMLFMVEADGTVFGHLGVRSFDFRSRTCEIDNVARGRDDVLPGGMTLALRGLSMWLFRQLHCAEAFVRVFADNRSAIALYERCGFSVVRTVPIQRVTANATVQWIERADQGAPCDRRLAYMAVSAPPGIATAPGTDRRYS